MEHVVFYPAHDGSPAFRRVAGLEEAVRLVEHLRNVEGVSEVSVHALAEVPLAFKAYYRVEVPAEPVAEPVAEAVPAAEPLPEVAPDLVPEQPQAEQPAVVLAASDGVAVGGSRSLGFFAS